MADLAQHMEARNDQDLRARFIAGAEQAGIADPAASLSTLKAQNYNGSVHMFVRAA